MKKPITLLVVFITLFLVSALVPTKAQQAEEKPMTKEQIVDLLAQDVACRRIAYLVRQLGLAFDVKDEDLELIRSSGGDEELISALNAAKALAEATKWIDNTFNAMAAVGGDNAGSSACSEPDGKFLDAGDFLKKWDWNNHWHCYNRSWYLFFDERCVVRIVSLSQETDWTKRDTGPYVKFKPDTELVFNLHDIDPSSIKSTPKMDSRTPSAVSIDFGTTNDDNLIGFALLHQGEKREKLGSVHALSGDFVHGPIVMKPDYAPRFIKAFRTAVESCGGKSSAF